MSDKLQAIVIRANDRKEKDKNILLFSIENGKTWVTLKGVKSPKAKMKMAANPFCFANFVLQEGKFGTIVTGFEMIESFYEITQNIDKYFEGAAVLEILSALDIENQSERAQVFVLAIKTLKNLCFSNTRSHIALSKFLLEFFKIFGLSLYTDKCSTCSSKAFERVFINMHTGEIECISCKGFSSEEMQKIVYLALKILSSTDFDKLATIKFAEGSEVALLKMLAKLFENHFDKKLKLAGLF